MPVTGLTVSGNATNTLAWQDQADLIGPGVEYDVVTGDLDVLHQLWVLLRRLVFHIPAGDPQHERCGSQLRGRGSGTSRPIRNACGIGTFEQAPLDAASHAAERLLADRQGSRPELGVSRGSTRLLGRQVNGVAR